MFRPVDTKVSFPQLEEQVLRFWKERDIFAKSVQHREGSPLFVLYEGPPTANGAPGVHHVISRVFKDVIPRYKTMQGFQAPRKGGWDTHGLPVELEIERELGLRNKREIEEYGIERFNERCRASVFRYVKEWEAMTDRIAFWVDMDDPYITFTNDYIESGWWIMKQLWDRGLVYLGYKTTPHCPRCGTSLSSHEVAQGYDENTVDPSIYVKFRIALQAQQPAPRTPLGVGAEAALEALFEPGTPAYVLAWTTTPWTLPGNTALAVSPESIYIVAEREARGGGAERLVLAEALADQALKGDSYRVVASLPGADLVGLRYQPLYQPPAMGFQMLRFPGLGEETEGQGQGQGLVPYQHPAGLPLTYPVIAGDFVSMDDGTGVVHIAPAFGEDDFEAGKAQNLFFVQHVDLKGEVQPCPQPFGGKFVKDADPLVIRDLDERRLLYRSGTITHTYPFCWRCNTPLLYYVKTSWYIRTTAFRQQLIDGNAQIHWYPSHIREGRFGDWLENNVDWAVSRERYWGTPLPIWRCESCEANQCVGSREELAGMPGVRGFSPGLDLHRPYVDEVTFECGACAGTMRRLPEVLDAWFDSGAMPYAQWHYPFEHRDTFLRSYPADFICEAVDQTRGWFYTLHALATLLNGAVPDLVPEGISYRHVICLGHILDSRGEKMSKSRGNVVDPWSVLNQHGADATRWYMYTATPAGNARRFSADLVGESLRRFLLTLWNTYSFFVIYANIDGYDPAAPAGELRYSELDRWVRSELNQLIDDVTTALEAYNPTDAGRRIQDFVDDLSNWYVRRSRRRFWKSENDADKLAAYDTLYTCLVTLAKLLAPFTPFVAEELYQNLVRSVEADAAESVHLCDYPEADVSSIDEDLNRDVRLVMRVASLGRAARSKAGIKVRQPLGTFFVEPRYPAEEEALRRLGPQLEDELNIKRVEIGSPPGIDRRLRTNDPLLGPRFGARLGTIKQALNAAPAEQRQAWYVQQAAGSPVTLHLPDGEEVTLAAQELTPEVSAPPDWIAHADRGYLVAFPRAITPELVEEGLARELVHRIQTMRRAAGFDIADWIETYCEGDELIQRVARNHQEYIRQETLSRRLALEGAPGDAHAEDAVVDGHRARLAVRRA